MSLLSRLHSRSLTLGLLAGLALIPCESITAQKTASEMRVTVTGHDVNRPDDYPGIGDFGWAGNIERLADGRLMLVHQWGYWHSSFSEPRMIEPELATRWRSEGWPLDFKAPTGGRSMATYSSDDGRTWSKPTTLVDHPQDDNPYGLLRTRDGSLTCFLSVQAPWYGYTSAPAEMKHLLDGLNTQQFYMRSRDDGKTWGRPTPLKSPGDFYQRSHATPIELKDGSILWPSYFSDTGTQGLLVGAIHRSTNSGRSWKLWSTIRREEVNVDEPAIAELASGEMILVCRPDGGIFHSSDGGRQWKQTGTLIDSGKLKAPRLFVLADGTVVCVATYGNLRVFLSRDHGYRWTDAIPLDTSSYGYPGGLLLKDNSMLISYVASGRAPSRIYVIRFSVNAAADGIELLPVGKP
ncbi:MAG: sialidase family protein [Planctomycetota bacterium]|nr:sialidase family protein [Planctomycetota bacterium]